MSGGDSYTQGGSAEEADDAANSTTDATSQGGYDGGGAADGETDEQGIMGAGGGAAGGSGGGVGGGGGSDDYAWQPDMSPAELIERYLPSSTDPRQLRACLNCQLVLSQRQFFTYGCPNCTHLEMKGRNERVNECTSISFKGFVAIMRPTRSWVAKWQKLQRVHPGCYAISVSGALPDTFKGKDRGKS
ncbi:transcription elongation factor SPT4 [Pelomyxa schiedti]|nr:transcription elongation factor SPT4 [Pelomyxa schiedti]